MEKAEYWQVLNELESEGLFTISPGQNGPEIRSSAKGHRESGRVISETLLEKSCSDELRDMTK